MIAHIYETDGSTGTDTIIASYIETYGLTAVSRMDVMPVEDKKELTVDQIRTLRQNVKYQYDNPVIVVMSAVDRSSAEVQNMLLKQLEEHQPSVHFVLFVESVNALVGPILSRCKVIRMKPTGRAVLSSPKTDLSQVAKLTVADVDGYIVSLLPTISSMRQLTYLLNQRQLLLNNNVTPQSIYDGILIFMKKAVTMNT